MLLFAGMVCIVVHHIMCYYIFIYGMCSIVVDRTIDLQIEKSVIFSKYVIHSLF